MADAFFYQYVTAELKLLVRGEGKPLEGYEEIVVSLDQGKGRGCYHGDYFFDAGSAEVDVDESAITVYLTQEESGKYAAVSTKVQVNIYYADHERDATLEGRVQVRENLYPRVID